ncbi:MULTISPECIES: hypothetical protein [unclassified Enterococcus]|uniref:hypothetical protein n=1 Tax=unclassified Enterococcus TaxID=2608891 RepID=UPI0013E9AAF4|nr:MULTISPECIES: hypothetical protein [unclassified Enterococcus]
MERFLHKPSNPNEIPIIFVRDSNGNVQKKVSVNEWNKRYSPSSLNELEIKLYRQALVYYGDKEYEKAIDLLKFLIAKTDYTHFEYIERLANIYHLTEQPAKEYQLLVNVLAVAELVKLPSGIVKKMEKRVEKVKKILFNQEK